MIRVNTLGKFQMMNKDEILNDDIICSTMLTKLLIYMIIYREQSLTMTGITSALWQEEEVENPAGALKNLVYRLRNLLKKHFGDKDFIITIRGAYCWNPEIKVSVDADEFEYLFEKARKSGTDKASSIYYYEQALNLYQGGFMPQIMELHWVSTRNTYYHSIFLSIIKGLVELYVEAARYEELEIVSNKALQYDSANEEIHYHLILARVQQNKLNLAMESYEKACEILKEELNISNPPRLQEIYEKILKMKKDSKVEDIECVQEDMSEGNPEGIFFCGYPVFREIYRLEARKNARTEENKCILLLTVTVKEKSTKEIETFQIKKSMERLEKVLELSLRLGDVAAKYNESQIVVLLSTCTYECCQAVADRIVANFYNANPKYQKIKIDVNLEKVTAAGTIVK